MYTSQLPDNCPIIDDANFSQYVRFAGPDGEYGRGLEPTPEGFSSPVASAFDMPLIPKDQWRDRIEEKERTKSTLRHLCEQAGLVTKNQRSTNYCWIFAPAYAAEAIRIAAGLPLVRLSPASVGSKIKNFRNQGGWSSQGLEYMAKYGMVPQDLWPETAINRQYDTEANWQRALDFRVTEWMELQPRNLEQEATCLLSNIPVACGYNWWGHAVCALGMVALDNGKFGVLHINSWGPSYGDNGYFVLTGSKMYADDQVAPRTLIPSEK